MDYYPTPAPGVLVEEIDEDICLYRADIDEVLTLNRSAADIWRLADGTRTEAEVLDRLAETYHVTTADLNADVSSVITDLVERGYLHLAESRPASTNSA